MPSPRPATTGPIDHLPTHNASYKRDALLRYGADLETLLQAEIVFLLGDDAGRLGNANLEGRLQGSQSDSRN